MKTFTFFILTGFVAAAAIAASPPKSASQNASNVSAHASALLFEAKCGMCHLEGGTGTFMLERRLGKDNALLAARTDLTADYVRAVVRQGLLSMPRFTRVELPDAELDEIAAHLSRTGSKR